MQLASRHLQHLQHDGETDDGTADSQ